MSEPTEVYPFRRNATISQENDEIKVGAGQAINNWNPLIIIYGIVTLIFAKGFIMQSIWVLAPAFCAAVVGLEGRKVVVAVTLGSLVGIWLGTGAFTAATLLNIAAGLIIIFAVSIFRAFFMKSIWHIPVLVFSIMVLIKGSYFLLGDYPRYYFLETTFEGFIAGSLSIAFVKGISGISELQKGILSKENGIGLSMLGIAILISLMDISFLYWNLGRTIALVMILWTAFLYGGGYGASIGVISGFAPALLTTVVSPYAGIFALSGLLAGIFRGFGKLGCIVGFMMGQLGMAYYLLYVDELNSLLIESISASLVFLLVPTALLYKAEALNPGKSHLRETEKVLLNKINDVSNIFKELSKTFKQISDDIEWENNARFDLILKSITNKVCSGCSVFMICWQREKKSTCQHICTLFNLIEAQGKVNKEDLPGELRKRCVRPDELVTVAGCLFETYLMDKHYRKKLSETKNLVSEQLQGVSAVMDSLAGEIKLERDQLSEKEHFIYRKMEEMGIDLLSLNLTQTNSNTLELDVIKEACKGKMECNLIVKPFLEEYLKESYIVDRSSCAIKKGELICSCKLRSTAALKVTMGFSQVKSEGTVICGDSYKAFEIKGGKHIIALSDGMGVGPKAAKESNTVISLLEQLLKNGFDREMAIRTINSVLGVRSEDETFATLDLTIIDIYSGEVEFIKIGAAPGFIKRGSQIGIIKANSHPLGILNGIEVTRQTKHLCKGDALIMVSDGILEAGEFTDKEGWMVEVIKELRLQDPQELAHMILRHALAVAPDIINDDMTVIVAKLE
ncbi:stage II sporulation protein E [Desulfitibacter alkalitolerans]|uniref:stage II sporulation protein E n=1 Tax=Desulfitibacter alkalitolerans TaxID=264641 RepID=UPI000483F947|nr:stage II sporulation protein E [Desulfitibacter alkalitolerans]